MRGLVSCVVSFVGGAWVVAALAGCGAVCAVDATEGSAATLVARTDRPMCGVIGARVTIYTELDAAAADDIQLARLSAGATQVVDIDAPQVVVPLADGEALFCLETGAPDAPSHLANCIGGEVSDEPLLVRVDESALTTLHADPETRPSELRTDLRYFDECLDVARAVADCEQRDVVPLWQDCIVHDDACRSGAAAADIEGALVEAQASSCAQGAFPDVALPCGWTL